jgi:hypothetical protein
MNEEILNTLRFIATVHRHITLTIMRRTIEDGRLEYGYRVSIDGSALPPQWGFTTEELAQQAGNSRMREFHPNARPVV